MNTPAPDDRLQQIKEALFRGQKIEAIKLFRQCFATGLAEAKDGVEKLEAELRGASPEKFSAPPARRNSCFPVVLALVLLLFGIVLLALLARR